MAGPWEKYASPSAPAASSGPWSKYAPPDQERDKIVSAYAEDIIRRNSVYGGIPQEQLQDPDRLWKLATLEAERAGFKPPQVNKQDRASSFALGYGQGGTFGFADELSGAVDFVGAAGSRAVQGDFGGAIDAGKEAYSDRVQKDRTLLNAARYDNPVTSTAGELTGGIVTFAPAPAGWMGAGARTTGQVALQTSAKADKLAKLATTASRARSAKLTAQSAALKAKSARLALPATTMSQAAGRFGGRLVEGAAKGVGYGAAYGGLYGFGAAEGSAGERLDETAQGALMGGVTGGVLSPAVQFVVAPVVGKIGYGILTSADNKALDIIIKRAERSGTSLQKVQADFDQWAKSGEVPETLAELMGPNERSLLSALITVNRETREQAAGVFVDRGRGEVNRLEDAFAKSFGASRKDFQKTKVAAAEARAKEAEPFYEGAYVDAATGQRKFLGQAETDALVYEIGGSEVAQETLPTAWKYADGLGKREIRDELKDFAASLAAGKQVKPLSVEAADYIERGINRKYGAASKGDALDIPAGLRGLRDRVRAIIDPTGLGDARATAAEAIRRGELLDEGLGIMSPTVDVDDVNRVMQGIPDAGIAPASDAGRTAYGVGASRAVANELRNVPDMAGFADATRKVARTPALRDKLEAARPKVLTKKGAENKGSKQTKANAALDTAIERASNRAQFGVDMVGNSKTAFRQGDVEDAVLDDAISSQVGQSLSDLLITGVGGAGNQIRDRLARTIGNRLGQPSIYRPNINRAAATVLLATGDQIPVQIARIARRAAQRANTRLTMRGLPPGTGGAPPAGPAPTGTPPTPPRGTPAGPIRAAGFGGFGGGKSAFDPETPLFRGSDDPSGGLNSPRNPDGWHGDGIYLTTSSDDATKYSTRGAGKRAELMDDQIALAERAGDQEAVARLTAQRDRVAQPGTPTVKELRAQMKKPVTLDNDGGTVFQPAEANRLIDALVGEIDDAGITYGASIGQALRAQVQKAGKLTASDFERIVRAEADADFIRAETSPGQVIANAYKALGYDGIVMKNAADVLPPGSTPKGTTHVVVFDKAGLREPGAKQFGPSALRGDLGQQVGAAGFGSVAGSTTDLNGDGKKDWKDAAYGAAGALTLANAPRAVNALRTLKPPSKLGTRTADAAAVASLAGAPTAEADTGASEARIAELTQLEASTQQQIAEYEQGLKDFQNLSVVEKQRFLRDNGFTGQGGAILKDDGATGGNTTYAINNYNKQMAEAIAAAQAERENVRGQINDVRVMLAEQGGKPSNPALDKAMELGSYVGAAYLAHRLRGAGVAKSQATARAVEGNANALLTRLPVPPPVPKKTLLSRVPVVGSKEKTRIARATTAANKAARATEERLAGRDIPPISSNPTSENGLPVRTANVDEFDRRRAAGEFGPAGPIGRFMEPVTSRVRTGDLGVMGLGAGDAYVMEGMLEKTRADIDDQEAELQAAREIGDPTRITAARAQLEKLRTIETVQTTFQRIGIGLFAGAALGVTHGRYAKPQPRFEAAARERDLIRLAQSPQPPPPGNALAPPTPAPRKPRTPPAPKPKPPVSVGSAGRPRKATNDNDR